MLDCACLAGITALRHFRKPDVEVVGDEVIVVRPSFASVCAFTVTIDIPRLFKHSPLDRAPVPLAIHHTPFCFTFAFFPDITTPPVLDPNQLEQRLNAGLVSIALNAQREICVLQKLGGVPLETEEVLSLVNVAVGKAKELHGFLDTQLREDWVGRKVEVR